MSFNQQLYESVRRRTHLDVFVNNGYRLSSPFTRDHSLSLHGVGPAKISVVFLGCPRNSLPQESSTFSKRPTNTNKSLW